MFLFYFWFAAANEEFPPYLHDPMMRADKLNNLQLCLNFLQEQHMNVKGVQVEGIHARHARHMLIHDNYDGVYVGNTDVLAGDVTSIRTICDALRTFYSPLLSSSTNLHRPLVYSTADMRVLSWVGELLGRDIKSYSMYVYTRNCLNL